MIYCGGLFKVGRRYVIKQHSAEVNRSIIHISGEDAAKFLQSMLTNDIFLEPVYAIMLSPQGRYLFDVFVSKIDDAYLLDVSADAVSSIIEQLTRYILRSKVRIKSLADEYAVVYSDSPLRGMVSYKDPRFVQLGYRSVVPKNHTYVESDYIADKYKYAIPDDCDLIYSKSLPQEYGIDLLHGISYDKGCYIGQEVVSRTKTQGVIRKRVFKVEAYNAIDHLPQGTKILCDSEEVGFLCSAYNHLGISLMYINNYTQISQMKLTIKDISISLSIPSWQ